MIDFSFWSKENRDFYKAMIEKAGGTVELVYMKASKEILRKRLDKRNLFLNANSPFLYSLQHHASRNRRKKETKNI